VPWSVVDTRKTNGIGPYGYRRRLFVRLPQAKAADVDYDEHLTVACDRLVRPMSWTSVKYATLIQKLS